MAQTINTNVASLNAQRNLSTSQGSLSTSIQRLSSGLRINSAKDDSAGLAISERFNSQIRGINQAVRNANDGISLAQTAEGALGEVSNNLQRMRELAVQSRNATNSTSDRQALDAEIQQLKAEIDRVAGQTSFNGTKLLDGTFSNQAFQVGANQGETISISSIANAKTDALGSWKTASITGSAAVTATGLAANELKINNVNVGAAAADAKAQATAINAISGETGVTATASNAGIDVGAFTTTAGGTYSLTIGDVVIAEDKAAGYTAANLDTDLAAAKDTLEAAGITYEGTAAGGDLKFTRSDGSNLTMTEVFGTGSTAGGLANIGSGAGVAGTQTTTFRGTLTLTSFNEDSFTVQGGTNAGLPSSSTVATVTTNTGFSSLNVQTVENADKMIVAMDAALKAINDSRADLGAIQNRFTSTIANLQTTSENLSASRGRIVDADFATETANLTRAQILQQAGTAMLAQANGLPQNVLSLLRG
ncbi:MAG TPA: flagellin [Azoarcus taiwanensis]|nr:flagellin [Azoarcus taiwanensis]